MLEKIQIGKHIEYQYAKIGKLYIDSQLSKDVKMQSVDKFLRASIIELMRQGYEILKDVSKSPYAYKQELFDETLVTKTLVKAVNKGFVMKSPNCVWNKANGKDESKMAQMWAQYRCRCEEYNYYIEMYKRSISYKNRKLTERVKNEWQTSCEKLGKIKAQLDKDEIKDAVGITVEVLNVYVSAAKEENLKYDLDRLIDLKQEVNSQLAKKYKANWLCLWTLDEKMVRHEEYIHGFEAYPAVLFLVRID